MGSLFVGARRGHFRVRFLPPWHSKVFFACEGDAFNGLIKKLHAEVYRRLLGWLQVILQLAAR